LGWGIVLLVGAGLLLSAFVVPWWRYSVTKTEPNLSPSAAKGLMEESKALAKEIMDNAEWFRDHLSSKQLAKRDSEPPFSIKLWGWNTVAGTMGLLAGLLVIPAVLLPWFLQVLRRWSWIGSIAAGIVTGLVVVIFSLMWFGSPSGSVSGITWMGPFIGPYLALVGGAVLLVGGSVDAILGLVAFVAEGKANLPSPRLYRGGLGRAG
jgi:hypothetical protein